MGPRTSFVRSLSMDTWTEKQLRLMALGGNARLKSFFENYDLHEENLQLRYSTRAAEFYRLELRSNSEMIPFNEEKPSYDQGREQMPPEEISDNTFESFP